ncbi:hypothetical protein FOA43_003694 [Brettanomyces nanus]|uniref:Uncharacterized protein n=1 Tax=Eeniella nana TaxID=13502 RepID=A0A875S5S9_EENNA|nr:uncharacterized protein FOA43_003694 [Brettanomyces nanus]QPG76308.1 hypothetical protein FOA43_003694 [Brettanomyces nanus]
MVKKVSRRSRAARRGEVDPDAPQDPSVEALDTVPRLEKTDVIGSMIRASVKKNSRLLGDKLNKGAKAASENEHIEIINAGIHKKDHGKQSKSVRTRRKKGVLRDGRLEARIASSVDRRRHRRLVRKSDWDSVNNSAKETLAPKSIASKDDHTEMSDDEVDVGEVGSGWKELIGETEESSKKEHSKSNDDHMKNAFALLDEVEA